MWLMRTNHEENVGIIVYNNRTRSDWQLCVSGDKDKISFFTVQEVNGDYLWSETNDLDGDCWSFESLMCLCGSSLFVHVVLFSSCDIRRLVVVLCVVALSVLCFFLYSLYFQRTPRSNQTCTLSVNTVRVCVCVCVCVCVLLLCASADVEWRRLKVDGIRAHLYSGKHKESADVCVVEISFYCVCV